MARGRRFAPRGRDTPPSTDFRTRFHLANLAHRILAIYSEPRRQTTAEDCPAQIEIDSQCFPANNRQSRTLIESRKPRKRFEHAFSNGGVMKFKTGALLLGMMLFVFGSLATFAQN